MGTTTRQVLRERLSQAIGDYYSLTSTGSGAGGGTTIVDADLANLTEDDGGIQGWTIQTSGNNAGEIRRIKNGARLEMCLYRRVNRWFGICLMVFLL